MLEGAGKEFDPILIKVFVNILGVYPVGTLLKLDTGELALVVRSSKNKIEKNHLSASWKRTLTARINKGKPLTWRNATLSQVSLSGK
jgi:hypothetical protein